jgi:ATP-dependent Clp protease ATP-binding subunit ClpA
VKPIIEAIENKKHNRNKKELLHAYVIARNEAIYSFVTFLLRQKSNQKRRHKNIGSAIFVG